MTIKLFIQAISKYLFGKINNHKIYDLNKAVYVNWMF